LPSSLIGAESADTREASSRVKEAVPHGSQPAQRHRKQVFDERRERFDGASGRHSVAGDVTEPVNRLPLALR